MKYLYLLILLFLFTSCDLKGNRVIETESDKEITYNYYNGIRIIDVDEFYSIKDDESFIIYLYDEHIFSQNVIDSIFNYSNLLDVKIYCLNINTIYTNNLLENDLYDDNYYFSNNGNLDKTSITNLNVYGQEAIVEFKDGKIKYTFSETNIVYKTKELEKIILTNLINIYKEDLRSKALEYFLNEDANVGKSSVKISELINRYDLSDNVLADAYKDYFILAENTGIYNENLADINSDEHKIIINVNTYFLTQISNYKFIIN